MTKPKGKKKGVEMDPGCDDGNLQSQSEGERTPAETSKSTARPRSGAGMDGGDQQNSGGYSRPDSETDGGQLTGKAEGSGDLGGAALGGARARDDAQPPEGNDLVRGRIVEGRYYPKGCGSQGQCGAQS